MDKWFVIFQKKNKLEDMSPFCGAIDTPLLNPSFDVSSGFQSWNGQPYLHVCMPQWHGQIVWIEIEVFRLFGNLLQ